MSNRPVSNLSVFVLFILVLLSAACGEVPAHTQVPPSPTATSAPTATASPAPTATSPPTPTPTPTLPPVDVELEYHGPWLPSSAVILRFNQAMDPESRTQPLTFVPSIAGQYQWNPARTRLTFMPDEGFAPGQVYRITLDDGLESATGERLAEATGWKIAVLSAPRVVRRRPGYVRNDDRLPALQLDFDRPMDQESLVAAFGVEPSVPLDLRYEDTTLHITPREPLTPGVRYSFELAPSAVDVYGIPLAEGYYWTHRLADLVADTTWPDRVNRWDEPLAVHFNYAMDTRRVEQAFNIQPPVEGELSWNDERTVLTFTPDERLSNQTAYTVCFDGELWDAGGARLASPGPFGFVTPPPILSVNPAPGRTAHPASLIKVTFDRPMDRDATVGAFQITPTLEGSFEWQETTLLFEPADDYLHENTVFTVTVGTAARDLDGEPILREPYHWSFYTEHLTDLGNFGWGPNAQVVDADGRRAVQFGLFQGEPAPLTFELYRLSLTQFLDRYASGFRGVAGWEERPIDTQGAVLAKSWQIETPRGENKYGNVQEVLIPDDVPPGLYILNLKAGHVNDQLILVLTRHTIAVKQAERQIVAWVTDINGGSAASVEVGVYARDGQLVSQGRTDQNGVYRARVARDPQPLIVVARDGDDVTASGLSNEWRSRGDQWDWWWRPAPAALDYAAYVYTDRPIYRPGQTVFFKAILRHDDDALLSLLPEGAPVTARIRDARDNVVQTFELTANHFGTVNGAFQLAKGAMLGDYAVEMSIDGERHRQVFKVQDYRKPDYRVRVDTDAKHYVVGDRMEVSVETEYFFGEPVPNASLVVKQYELGGYYYWWLDEMSDDYIWYQSARGEIRGKTDAEGRFTFTLDAAMGNFGRRVHWRGNLRKSTWGIEVTVDDGSHQTVSNFAVVHVFDGAEKVYLDTGGYLKTPGQPFTVRAQAATIFDEPTSDRSLRLELRRYNSKTGDYDAVLQAEDLVTGPDGQASTLFTVPEPGYYRLHLKTHDQHGNEISYRSWVYVFDDVRRWVSRNGELSITADRDQYAPGDVARLVVESPFSGPALLTFERGTTRREQLIELSAPLTLVEVEVLPDDAPNVFVTVNAWKEQDTTLQPDIHYNLPDSRLHTASVELRVPVTDKTLNVTITPDKSRYAPREEASFTVKVTDARGEPVSAELSLALVDEAIFGLSDELSGPIFDAFYHERERIVRTYDSLALTRYIPDGGRGGGGGGGGPFTDNPRSDFPDTAAWFPVLHTDWKGEAVVKVTLPDSLTSWRLTAKATSPDTKVGETFINVLTAQPIVVRPILPRSLTAGDRVALSAIVHNYSDQSQRVDVSIQSDRFQFGRGITQTIDLAPDELRIVGWSATALEAGEAEVLVVADAGEMGDAVRLTVPIRPLAIPQVDTQVGEFSGEFNTSLVLPTQALDLSSTRIELSRSIAGSLLTGLEYLTGFPYGCVEQTMSRALPNAVVGRAFHQLGVGNPALQADLPPKINAGLQRLYGYQHNDGGWGWWYDDSTHDYQTAWVVFGLAVTAEAGYEVDSEVIERGVDWLAENLDQMDIRTRAYALYSMATAGYGDLEAARAMTEQLDKLDTFSQAALALALHELGATTEAEAIVDHLAESATVDGGKVYWTSLSDDGHYRAKTMASSTRSTALALSAFVRVSPDHELEPGIVRWLMGQRQQYGWGTTNETAYTILALTDHLLAVEAATADTGYAVTLNGELVASGTLGRGEPAVSLEIPADRMKRGANDLHIQQSGGGRLYYVINNRVYLPEAEIEAAGDVGIVRVYLDPETNKPVERVRAGQLVKVSLRVHMPDDGSYIIVEDRLPGGLEALNEGLNTTSHAGNAEEEPRYYWQAYGYNHKEVHGDRVSFFITELVKGHHTFTYVARATHNGEFVALPAEAYAMYDLTVWGRSASSLFTITGRLGPLAN